MRPQKSQLGKLNWEIDIYDRAQDLTVGSLKKLLSQYPDNAKVLLHNMNAGSIPLGGITSIVGVNATKRDKDRVFVLEDEGPISAVILGFWNEYIFDIKYGPKQQAEIDARIAADKAEIEEIRLP